MRKQLLKYSLIIRKIKLDPYSNFEAIRDFVLEKSEIYLGKEELIILSKRTFERALRELEEIFNLEIIYSRSRKGYKVDEEHNYNTISEQLIDSFEMAQYISANEKVSRLLDFEDRRFTGEKWLVACLEKCRLRRPIQVHYQSFKEEKAAVKLVQPAFLKEFKKRWYLIGVDLSDFKVKSYGLDRIVQIETSNHNEYKVDLKQIKKRYEPAFGVIVPDDEKVERLILKLSDFQSKYIINLPLHSSQTITKVESGFVYMEYNMYITYDLIMELRSLGKELEVIEPRWVKMNLKH